jgi:outer membrane lipoprotein SlyB
MKRVIALGLSFLTSMVIFNGCAADNTAGGAVLGATIGAVAGASVGNHRDAMIGAAGGAVAGALVGQQLDEDERERELQNYR